MENNNKKFSLSLASKASSKPSRLKPSKTFVDNEAAGNNESSSAHQYVTEFDSSEKPLPLGGSSNGKSLKIVISPQENEFKPYKRMKNLDLPLRCTSNGVQELSFEVESSVHAGGQDPGTIISYGLNLRQPGNPDGSVELRSDDRHANEQIDNVLLKKLKDDMNRLPDDDGFEQFEEVPVEGFGAALMAGYGWKEGMGIGRNAKGDVKVMEYKRRPAREGVGVFSDPQIRNDNNMVEDSSSKRGKRREREGENEKNLGFSVGMEVRIISGPDKGLKGRIVEVSSGGGLMLVLELSRGKERMKVHVNDVAKLGSVEEEKCLKKLKELKIRASKDIVRHGDQEVKDSSNLIKYKEREESKKSQKERSSVNFAHGMSVVVRKDDERGSRIPWLRSHIRVRIISKDFKEGRLYLKKGEVVDVVGPTTCDISMDDSREIVQGVDQTFLETALPRRGGRVFVVLGKHKGTFGSLVERNSEKDTGIIQNTDTHEFLNVKLDHIAEYVGDPSDFEY